MTEAARRAIAHLSAGDGTKRPNALTKQNFTSICGYSQTLFNVARELRAAGFKLVERQSGGYVLAEKFDKYNQGKVDKDG